MTWSVLGESIAGTSHRTRNLPCQDAFRIAAFGPQREWLAIAVADGAGSASRSELGATLACDEFIQRIEAGPPELLFTREGVLELFAAVRGTVALEAERHELLPRELACTALLAVVGPDSASFAQIGDGAIVIGDGAGYRTAFWPEPSEYANTTDFLTDDQFADKIQFTATNETISELAVLTDGLQRLVLDFATRTPHAPFFRPLFRDLSAASDMESLQEPFRNFLDSSAINARTDDDKTLVLAARRP